MATFEVDIDGATYEVDAPDENTAWKWANATHKPKSSPKMVKVGDPGFDPTEGMSGTEKFLAGTGKAFVDIGKGAGQMLGLVDRNEIDQSKELDAPLMKTGAGMAGNIFGNVAATAPLALIPGAATIPGGAAIGAATGAFQPVGTEDSRLGNMAFGGATGAALPAAVRVGKTAKAALIDPFTEAGRTRIAGSVLNRVAEDPKQVYARLLSAKGNTPGFYPTVGQSADDAGVASLERTVRATNPQLFDSLDKGQRQALADAVRGIAKDEIERGTALTARREAAKRLYGEALDQSNMEEVTPYLKGQVTQLLKRPSINRASKDAQRWAMERGEKPAVKGSLRALHDVKQSLDDMLAEAKMGGKGGDLEALGGTKDKLLNVMETLSPKYQEARQAYAQMSRPINQMDVGKAFTEKLIPSLYRDMPAPQQLNAAAYAKALTDQGDDIARNVTGMSGATLDKILEPDQLQSLKNVAADLQKMKVAENAGRGVGSDTVQKASMSHIAAESGVPNWMSSLARVPGGWAKRAGDVLYGNADDQVRMMLADMLRNPQDAAQAMKSAGVRPSQMAEILKRVGQVPAFALPASANASE